MALGISDGVNIALPSSPPGGIFLENLPFISQPRQTDLCWAACGAMTFALHTSPSPIPSMTDIASRFSVPSCDCTGILETPPCNRATWPSTVYNSYEYSFKKDGQPEGGTPLSPELIASDLRSGFAPQPYLVRTDGTTHTVLIAGQYDNGDLLVHDPLCAGATRHSYDDVCNALGSGGAWPLTWYQIKPA